MIDQKEKERMLKVRSRYSVFATVPIIIALIHVLGQVIVQSTLTIEEEVFTHPFPLAFTFGSSYFATILTSSTMTLQLASQVPSVVAIIFTLLLIFLSSSAVKGKPRSLHYAGLVYVIDTIALIVSIILSYAGDYPISMSLADVIVNLIIHALGLAVMIYGIIYSRKMEEILAILNEKETSKGALYQAPEEK